MKKILISITLIIVAMVANIQLVFGEGTTVYTVTPDVNGDSFTVAGTVSGNKGNVMLTLVVKKPDGSFFAGAQTVAMRNSQGKIAFAFDEIKFPYAADTGMYSFTVTGDGFTAPTSVPTYNYVSLEDKRQLLIDINALAAAGGSGIYEKVSPYAELLGVSASELSSFDTDAIDIFNTCMKTKTYTVPDALDTEAKVLQVRNSCGELVLQTQDAFVVASFANIKDADMTADWMTRNYTALDFDKNDAGTPEDEAVITTYFNNVKGTATFATRIAACNNVASLSDVREDINESALLSAIETMHFSNTYSIITGFPSLFTINTTNLATLGGLSSEAPGEIYTQIAKNYYANYADVITAFDTAVTNAISLLGGGGTDEGTDGGGWTGGGGGGVSITDKKDNTTDKPSASTEQLGEAQNNGFRDLADVEWAKDAIIYLSERGIINGKAQGVFAPNDFITRAEFIKILVGATNAEIKSDAKSSFADVSANKWYVPYLAAAEKNKLVLGSDDNLFMPESNITRQDVAVILYRAFKPLAKTEPLKFKDTASISDYAAEAVESLTAAKIINGMGDGMFSPLEGATRAQAAVMIYKLIK
ncbi:MAG: S-layer homology domain-containing protein [Clostridia bacterium]|nr:S-layer homology domain-containing protein [Clostridia bacterium]